MRRIASTAKHATSRTPTRTSRGFLLRAAAGQTIRTCEGVFTRIPGRRCRTADFVVSLPRHQSSESQCARLFVRRNFPENRGGTADPNPNSPQRRCLIGPGRHDAALIPAFKGGGHARSGQLLRAGPKQSINEKLRPGIRENDIVAEVNKFLYTHGSDDVVLANA